MRKRSPPARPARLALTLLRPCLVVLTGLSLAGLVGAEHFFLLDLTTHFRGYYVLLALAAAPLCWLLGSRRFAVVAGLVAVLNLAFVLPWYLGAHQGPAATANAKTLRLLVANVHTDNHDKAALLRLIAKEQPDVFVLQEIDQRWGRALGATRATYPHRFALPRPDNFGIGLYSKHPLLSAQALDLGGGGLPSIHARLQLGARELIVLATHPFPPMNGRAFAERNRTLDAAARRINAARGPRLWMGDFNASIFSPVYRRVVAASGLLDPRRGRGLLATWPVGTFPLSLLRIPIDHCLHSRELALRDFRVGPPIGSDHLPLLVDLVLLPR